MVRAPLYSVRTKGEPVTLSIPNLITLGRILLVPVVVWAISSGAMWIAFVLFLAAGVSDAVDGFLAKRFGMTTELGAYLDPLADKALIVSIYVALGISKVLPGWLVILVVSRDIMIVGAVVLTGLPELLRGFQEYRMVVQGALLLLTIVFLPHGVADTLISAIARKRIAVEGAKAKVVMV